SLKSRAWGDAAMMMTMGGVAVTNDDLGRCAAIIEAILADPKAVRAALAELNKATLAHNVAQAAAAKQAEDAKAIVAQADALKSQLGEREAGLAAVDRQQAALARQLAEARQAL